ncbi:MAG: hypothetical protein U0570_08840 [Phycisphaerales bacterium]
MIDPRDIEKALAGVTDQGAFLRLLSDTLRWPIDGKSVEDVSYAWTEKDLRAAGLDKKVVDSRILQIANLDRHQPWGVFVIEFKNPDAFLAERGLTGVLRQVLRGLVPSKRKDANQPAWNREHLLFICTHKYEHFRVAYFKAPREGTKTAPLAAFGWGPDIPARTACEFNLPALEWPDNPSDTPGWVSAWADAFNVERVTRRFYKDYAEQFEKLRVAVKPLKGEDQKMFTQALMNRLMFLRFIERKGWLTPPTPGEGGHSKDYLRLLFQAGGYRGKSFYSGRLKKLFFEALAIEGKARSEAVGTVVFLNGGLFEESELDKQVDDLPDSAFAPLLGPEGLLYRYNFTVQESTPLDIEVAVDPEMLGKVFEELVTGRHESGSYYTPRPIVSFMCREALKGYLTDATRIDSETVAAFVDRHDVKDIAIDGAKRIARALDEVRAVDPACGSGAYLLGLLHEIVDLYRLLYNDKLKSDSRELHRIKLDIIEKSLYGVDIDPVATNIAMLRLWLSLTVDSDEPQALPNLDFKIETGDSLAGPNPQEMPDLLRVNLDERARQLAIVKGEYLRARGHEKQSLRRRILKEQREISVELLSLSPGAIDWRVQFCEVFFSSRGGFDIAIANPPYGLINKRQNQQLGHTVTPAMVEAIKASDEFSPVLRGMLNICVPFIRRSFSLLKQGGTFAEIFPLAFAGDLSFAPLRRYVFTRTTVRSFEAFPERDDPKRRVFESAKMSVCILIATNEKPVAARSRFAFRINRTPHVSTNTASVELTPSELSELDSNSTLPLVGPNDLRILQKIRRTSTHLSAIGRCYTGEIDLTLARPFITNNARHALMHKGAIIGRYLIRSRMSQGEIEYLDSKRYLEARGKRPDSSAWHHEQSRIVMQGITGVNERVRLKMTLLAPGAFCANSANYIRLDDPSEQEYLFVLGVMNSQLTNYFFKAFSTNSNVNGYEVDSLPIPAADARERVLIRHVVAWLLVLHRHAAEVTGGFADRDMLMLSYLERLLNGLIYELYFRDSVGDLRLFDLLATTPPPPSGDLPERHPLAVVRTYFEGIYDSKHPVRAALDVMQAIDVVRIIEAES